MIYDVDDLSFFLILICIAYLKIRLIINSTYNFLVKCLDIRVTYY
jgi:hypothetical protein